MASNTDRIIILNVEDNEQARYAKSRLLRAAGFDVIEAENGEHAFEKLDACVPDLVLLDTKLPGLSGFEVCQRIKHDPRTAAVLILQTSAYLDSAQDRVRALECGADNYLIEPIESEELIANVRALLRLGRSEKLAREHAIRLSEIAGALEDVFWLIAPQDKQILYVSPAYERIWERSAGALLVDPHDWLERVHTEDRDRLRARFAEMTDLAPYEDEYRLLMDDGSIRWIHERTFPVVADDDRSARFARISYDITTRKIAELSVANAERYKDQFLSTLAHELRNPLSPILHSIQLMQPDSPPDRIEKYLSVIERQTRQLTYLVDDLLDVARLSQHKVTIAHTPVPIRRFITQGVSRVDKLLEQREHTLSMTLSTGDLCIEGDEDRLIQVIANLVENAAKYTPKGGRIGVRAEVRQDTLVIHITDNGIGISSDLLASVFDLFVQAEYSPDLTQEGLGIGLSLVRQLAELHGGQVRAVSAGRNLGTRIELTLPLTRKQPTD